MVQASDIHDHDGVYNCTCYYCGDTQHFDTFKEALKYDCGCMSDKIAEESKWETPKNEVIDQFLMDLLKAGYILVKVKDQDLLSTRTGVTKLLKELGYE